MTPSPDRLRPTDHLINTEEVIKRLHGGNALFGNYFHWMKLRARYGGKHQETNALRFRMELAQRLTTYAKTFPAEQRRQVLYELNSLVMKEMTEWADQHLWGEDEKIKRSIAANIPNMVSKIFIDMAALALTNEVTEAKPAEIAKKTHDEATSVVFPDAGADI